MSLFEKFTKKKPGDAPAIETTSLHETNIDITPKGATAEDESEGYYFQNPIELAIYGKFHGKDKTVYWLTGNDYIEAYNKGFHLFEQGRFQEALTAYRASLKLNPIGLSARFEICEVFIKMQNYADARKTLLEMRTYLIEEENIARFYRRLGFIATEEGNYDCALAAYAYSLNFKNHPSVKNEMDYIQHVSRMGGFKASSIVKNAASILTKNGLPVLTETKLN